MHVGIITYQTGHLKTWQLLRKLQTKSYQVTLFAFPFKRRPQHPQIFAERPNQLIDLDIAGYCMRTGIKYVTVGGWEDEHSGCLGFPNPRENPDVFLTCIAKIIPAAFISNRVILNAHPGLLPENRGLDAFKWSIINGWPIGVSLHAIDEKIDQGLLLHRSKVPVLPDDTLSDLAARAYETECDLQANFDYHLKLLSYGWKVGDHHPLSTRRIPPEMDSRLEDIFQANKQILIDRFLEPDPDQPPLEETGVEK